MCPSPRLRVRLWLEPAMLFLDGDRIPQQSQRRGRPAVKFGKRFAIALCVYVGIVVAFESLIGFFQPAGGDTLVITTRGSDGASNDRVLSRLESGGYMYVAANHWPRAWYEQALENPKVDVTIDGERNTYLAVSVSDEEHDRVGAEHSSGVVFRMLTGFPPRYFLRLDPRQESSANPTVD